MPKTSELSRRSFVALTTAGALGFSNCFSRPKSAPTLSLPPFLARPTENSVLLNAQMGDVAAVANIELRLVDEQAWRSPAAALTVKAGDFFSWNLSDLSKNSRYEYRINFLRTRGMPNSQLHGKFSTQKTGNTSFSAALITDSHTGSFPEGTKRLRVLDKVVNNVALESPDFVLALGDNIAWITSRSSIGSAEQPEVTKATDAYTMYRRHLGPLSKNCPHFGVIGNWEGESGKYPQEAVAEITKIRKQFTPNPTQDTYRWGGSSGEDYYAFDWGLALFVVLNVQSYSRPSSVLATAYDDVSRVEDWTLGKTQFSWLETTLRASDHPYVFLCIHHPVGGRGGNHRETLYGRGGYRAAAVGEQRLVHELMREYGVQIFFYGHDHVFVDEVLDGIHYALPGSCGAPWKFGTDITGYNRFWKNSGHARLNVEPHMASVEYFNLARELIHRFEVTPRKEKGSEVFLENYS